MKTSMHQYFAATAPGIEPLLEAELRAMGALDVEPAHAGVSFRGDLAMGYRACLWSRTATRVLMHLKSFHAKTPEELYAGIQGIDWAAHLASDGTLAVDFNAARSRITHTHFGALKVKDAIVDQFRDRTGERPSVDVEQPHVRINVYLLKNEARVSLDLSGESLHRRGYRARGVAAPLKENLAAAILIYGGWTAVAQQGGAFLDPLCGSGTLPIEAALIAGDVAPGLQRTYFGFLHWHGHDAAAWKTLLDEAMERRERGLANLPPIVGCDLNGQAVRAALDNIARADLRGKVHVERRELAAAEPPAPFGLMASNPPYGERIGAASELPGLYAQWGSVLRERFPGWRAALFTGNPDLAQGIGLRARRERVLFNGPLECRLFNYEVAPEEFVTPVDTAPRERRLEPHTGPLSDNARAFENRLRKNLKHLGKWARREQVDCWRVYDADLPEYAVAVDLYQSDRLYVHVQEYEAPATIDPEKADQRLREALALIPGVLEIPPEQMTFKVRRRQRGSAQYEKFGSDSGFHEVREGRCRLLVNLGDYLDTGLFLDHRITRQMVEEKAAGKRFLNLFCYTGAATVHAAVGGAATTTSVDMSATYLEWARRNLRLNGFAGAGHELVQGDCIGWLEDSAGRAAESYDLIFLDPPTFSNSKRMEGTFDVQRDHVMLIGNALALLAPGGELLFSTNLRKFRFEDDRFHGFEVKELTRATLPPDFERNPRIHQCWSLRKPAE
jgi:23S rRNA (guanine2445-N2)-methyltransferase / 23S rRNA (guanine2069-N7)-methyltransferase